MEFEDVAEDLVEQARRSACRGVSGKPDAVAWERNPLCGDEVRLGIYLDGDIVRELRFDGRGCVVSQGAAAMLCERVSGMRIDEVVGATVESLLGFDPAVLTMNRQRCARLAYEILQNLLVEIPNEKRPSATNSIDCGREGCRT